MENASKALFIAAGVLVGIMILSLAVYLIFSFGGTSSQIIKQKQINQINQFNNQFLIYEGKTTLTIHDVVTIANLATQSNRNRELSSNYRGNPNAMYVTVFVNGMGYLDQGVEVSNINHYSDKILQDIQQINGTNELPKYTAKVKVSEITQMVYFITITKT